MANINLKSNITEAEFKSKLGREIIISHFCIILLVIVLYFLGGFLFEQMTTTVALLIPIFSVYTTAIYKSIVAGRTEHYTYSKEVTKDFVFAAFWATRLLTIFMTAIIILMALNIRMTFEQFKIMIGLGQTMFGVYFGLVLSPLFGIKDKDTEAMEGQSSKSEGEN